MLARHRHFTRNGTCIGHIDEVGHYFRGRAVKEAAAAARGATVVAIAVDGRVWDEHGKGRGYLDKLSADAGKAPGRIADEPESGRRRGAPVA